ncbi:MAG: type II toxin-antitoxin system RelE/ParE family toxin [Defluviitaleaceae bacterium]|nr:type II toxin-antitoxin system RelE/ParE family toxin [Defluviitaleaceae bacterium]
MKPKFDRIAVKQIEALDKAIKQRIKVGIYKLPAGDVVKLKGYGNQFRLRIGGYRVIFTMVDKEIIINEVLPRGSSYKN